MTRAKIRLRHCDARQRGMRELLLSVVNRQRDRYLLVQSSDRRTRSARAE
jgi:hypothetical protein